MFSGKELRGQMTAKETIKFANLSTMHPPSPILTFCSFCRFSFYGSQPTFVIRKGSMRPLGLVLPTHIISSGFFFLFLFSLLYVPPSNHSFVYSIFLKALFARFLNSDDVSYMFSSVTFELRLIFLTVFYYSLS